MYFTWLQYLQLRADKYANYSPNNIPSPNRPLSPTSTNDQQASRSNSLSPDVGNKQLPSVETSNTADEEADRVSPLLERGTRPSSADLTFSDGKYNRRPSHLRRHTLDDTATYGESGAQPQVEASRPEERSPSSARLRRTNSDDIRRDRPIFSHPYVTRSATQESLFTSAGESEEGWITPRTGLSLSPTKSPTSFRRNAHSPLAFRSNAGRELYNLGNSSYPSSHRNASSRSGSGSSGGTRAPLNGNGTRGLASPIPGRNVNNSSINSAPATFVGLDRIRHSGDDRAWFEDSPRRNGTTRTRPGIPQRFMQRRDWSETSRDGDSASGDIDEIKGSTKIEVSAVTVVIRDISVLV
jgi:hypothetical protein